MRKDREKNKCREKRKELRECRERKEDWEKGKYENLVK